MLWDSLVALADIEIWLVWKKGANPKNLKNDIKFDEAFIQDKESWEEKDACSGDRLFTQLRRSSVLVRIHPSLHKP